MSGSDLCNRPVSGVPGVTAPFQVMPNSGRPSVTDNAGNTSKPVTATYEIDTVPPNVGAPFTGKKPTGDGGVWFNASDLGGTNETLSVSSFADDLHVSPSSGIAARQGGCGETKYGDGGYDGKGQIFLNLGDGSWTLSCTAFDVAGNEGSADIVTFKIDTNAPTIIGTGQTADGSPYDDLASRWTNQDVTVHFSCNDGDGGSGVASCEPSADQTFTSSTGSVAASATDIAGNSSTGSFGPINIDKIAPTITASATNADGSPYRADSWTNQAVTVHYSCADTGGSGPASCSSDQVFKTGGTTPSTSGTAQDGAGNSASASFGQIMIDTVNPAVTFSDCPTGAITTGAAVTVHWSATDPAPSSGLIAPTSGSFTLNTSALGAGSVSSGPVSDKAGNTASASCNYTVGYNILAFFAPVPKSKWKPGQTVPIKIALTNSAGTRVQACSACSVTFQATKVGTTGQAVGPTPMTYDPTTKQYQYNWKLATKGTGLTNLIVTVTYPDGSKTTSPPVPIVIGM